MEPLLVLFLLGLFGLLVAALVFGVLGLTRVKELAARIDRLEKSLAGLGAPAANSTEGILESSRERAAPPMPLAFESASALSSELESVSPLTSVEPRHFNDDVAPPHPSTSLVASASASQPSSTVSSGVQAAHVPPIEATEPAQTDKDTSASDPRSRATTREGFERWVGVRGAALLGGIFLAIAGFLFFQYSIEHGLITPSMRVVLGTITGVACIGVSLPLRKRGYAVTADALTGAGAVVLYAAYFAAHSLYHLVPFGVSFAVMVLVTIACCALALRHGSQWIAALGFAGGFATPLVLSTGQDRPIGLFGYVLLLDLGFLFVAGKRRWPSIGLLGLLGTFAIEALWTIGRMQRETYAIGLVILGVFALLFVVFVGSLSTTEQRRWRSSQVGAVLLPFALALYFAQRAELGPHLYPVAALCGLLGTAACFVARRQSSQASLGTAAGSVAIVFVWILSNRLDEASAWELSICAIALAVVFHAFSEWKPRASDASVEIERTQSIAANVIDIGLLALVVRALVRNEHVGPWPWIAALVALSLLTYRQAALANTHALQSVASTATGIGWLCWNLQHAFDARRVTPLLFIETSIGLALLFVSLTLVRRVALGRTHAWHAAAVFAAIGLASFGILLDDSLAHVPSMLVLGGMIALGLCLASAANGARTSTWFSVAVLSTMILQLRWIDARRAEGFAVNDLVWLLVTVVVFNAFPLLRPAITLELPWMWRAAALAPLLWFPAVKEVFEGLFGKSWIGGLPFTLAAIAGLGAWRVARLEPHVERAASGERRTAIAIGWIWFSAIALVLASSIVPLQLDREVWSVTAALVGCALAWLWRRTAHAPLRILATLSIALATIDSCVVRLTGQFETPRVLVLDWISYAYVVPALAAFAAAGWMKSHDDERAPASESNVRDIWRVHGASIASVCGLMFVFAWINLEIAGAFARESTFDLSFEHMPARDLTASIAWAVYALVLLALGVQRKRSGLRWASLAIFVLTIGKVFLFDLGNLEGLYRVASMLGLALSLLFVSLVYQRFVFWRGAVETA